MGCFTSVPAHEKEARTVNRDIESSLKKEKKKFTKEIRLLLLGTGESGKSTIAKQMKIIHLKGFSQDELLSYKPIIQSNTLESIKTLISRCKEYNYQLEEVNNQVAEEISQLNSLTAGITPKQVNGIRSLWKDPAIQETYKRQNEFQLPDVCQYLFENLDRISNPNYIPDQNDCLRCRARTTGIIETDFVFQGTEFKMIDVGGQRSERKKWIHCFQDVTAVIFCVALSEYDQVLFEDPTTNRMHESLKLFDQICNSKWFTSISMILFLNKSDIFQDKIAKKDLKCCFPEYTGGCDFLNATQFIEQRFIDLNKDNQKKNVYTHITCATNTENIRFVFTAVRDIILLKSLEASGFEA